MIHISKQWHPSWTTGATPPSSDTIDAVALCGWDRMAADAAWWSKKDGLTYQVYGDDGEVMWTLSEEPTCDVCILLHLHQQAANNMEVYNDDK